MKFFNEQQTIIITGANGWIGHIASTALASYNQILIDNKFGFDPYNRFGHEHVASSNSSAISSPNIHRQELDLAEQPNEFIQLINYYKPECVLHLAGILENQEPEKISKNFVINKNVLEACAKTNTKLIAASSIMVMYGAALAHPKIKKILEREFTAITSDEKLAINTPFQNTEEIIKNYFHEDWQKVLTYIKTKEALEELAHQLTQQSPDNTFVLARFGWTGVRNPYEIEQENHTPITETSVYCTKTDLENFIKLLVRSIITNKISGCKTYVCVSNHPQSWVDISNAMHDFGWEPKENIIEKFSPENSIATVLKLCH